MWQTEHKENRPQHRQKKRSVQRQKNATTTKGMTTFRGSITRFQSAVHIQLMWALLAVWWCWSYRYKLVKCHAHRGVCEMLCRWVGPGTDTTLGKPCGKSKNQEDKALITGHNVSQSVLFMSLIKPDLS